MKERTYTNEELIRTLRDDRTMSDRELLLLDRITMMLDEIDALTDEIKEGRGGGAMLTTPRTGTFPRGESWLELQKAL